MDRTRFDDYVRRFNAQDATAFEDYLGEDVHVQNGRPHYDGVQGMKDHYARIWRSMRETLEVLAFVSDGATMAVELHTHFEVLRDDADSPFGAVRVGTQFDYHGVVMYRVAGGKIRAIKVSYLDFTRTDPGGQPVSLGIVH